MQQTNFSVAVEAVASANVCSSSTIDGLLMRFVDEPMVIPVFSALLKIGWHSRSRRRLSLCQNSKDSHTIGNIVKIWRTLSETRGDKCEPISNVNNEKQTDHQVVEEAFCSFTIARKVLESNPIIGSIELPLSLIGLRYHHLQKIMLEEFGALVLGLQRQAPTPFENNLHVSELRNVQDIGEKYLSASPDPMTKIRKNDSAYILRTSTKKTIKKM